jgi:crossover junction endodeoxyribonuclease RuvC
MVRLAFIRSQVLTEAQEPYTGSLPDVAILEGYSHGSPNQAHYLGELGGVVRLALYDAGVPYVDIAPKKRAKYATGNGNGSKDAVLQAAVHRSGRIFDSNDAADAWWLWQMGLAHYDPGSPHLVKMPAKNLEALREIQWAVIGKEAS